MVSMENQTATLRWLGPSRTKRLNLRCGQKCIHKRIHRMLTLPGYSHALPRCQLCTLKLTSFVDLLTR